MGLNGYSVLFSSNKAFGITGLGSIFVCVGHGFESKLRHNSWYQRNTSFTIFEVVGTTVRKSIQVKHILLTSKNLQCNQG